MTTKKKTTPKPGEKAEKAKKPAAKALTEPAATATRASMKAPKAAPPAKAEAPAAPAPAPVAAEATPAKADRPIITIGQFQKRLHEKGYYQGAWDGHYGPMTKHAVAHLQHANGLHPDGEPTSQVLALLGF